jgi:hypothetical protein
MILKFSYMRSKSHAACAVEADLMKLTRRIFAKPIDPPVFHPLHIFCKELRRGRGYPLSLF